MNLKWGGVEFFNMQFLKDFCSSIEETVLLENYYVKAKHVRK